MDYKVLAAEETIAEKEAIQKKEIHAAALRVEACIALAFKYLQNNSTIWLPYNFE